MSLEVSKYAFTSISTSTTADSRVVLYSNNVLVRIRSGASESVSPSRALSVRDSEQQGCSDLMSNASVSMPSGRDILSEVIQYE
jgi:hypothetical protein